VRCSEAMALKVIGTGFGRTGTMSAYTALNQLGFPCYHMFEVIENKENKTHLDFWVKVANTPAGTKHDWDAVFSKYTAAVDNPACCVWRELMQAYPDKLGRGTSEPADLTREIAQGRATAKVSMRVERRFKADVV